jgi:F0F1-type ATP synthase assembly protein I
MQNKKTENARMIFAFMVPITIVAFLLGALTTDLIQQNYPINMTTFDILGMVISTIGVLMFNLYEEKPQKASIEQF